MYANRECPNPVAPPATKPGTSLSTWVHPTDGTGYLYYPKGSLAGFLLDILIRDASDNRRSLDDVLRDLYRSTYKRGRGFGMSEWWGAVTRAAGGRKFNGFHDRYIDGRDPFPWDSVLPLAELRLRADTLREPRLGIGTATDSTGTRITGVVPGCVAAEAGLRAGDVLLALGEVAVTGEESLPRFRAVYAGRDGAELPIRIRREGQEITLAGKVPLVERLEFHLELDPMAPPKAQRVRLGLFAGATQR